MATGAINTKQTPQKNPHELMPLRQNTSSRANAVVFHEEVSLRHILNFICLVFAAIASCLLFLTVLGFAFYHIITDPPEISSDSSTETANSIAQSLLNREH